MEEWTIATLKEHLDAVLTERDKSMREILHSSTEAIERIETRINQITSDHVTRAEFEDVKINFSQNKGAKTAFVASLSIILTLMGITLGAMYDKQVSPEEISRQISRESPWLADRPAIESRLDEIDKHIVELLIPIGKN